ncbi:arsenate-mycothiol transferase ArsC [Kineococcus sp. G2]|uniref:arsenate-mycothiol transferase ArsC n=1 Tax=Kineococcus sp. G2 TaxID=3127484 RepID=UPI00301DEBF2
MATPPFTVLVVCTANVHRSPLTAALLRHRLDERFGPRARRVRVLSAGTRAATGTPVDPTTARVVTELSGAPPPGGGSRPLDAGLVADADVVLALAREHRAAVVELVPAAQRRTYTLPELARIATSLTGPGTGRPGADPAAGWRALLAAAPALRGPTAPADPATDDVPDVHGRPLQEHRRTAERVGRDLDAVLDAVAQRSTGSGSGSTAVSGW